MREFLFLLVLLIAAAMIFTGLSMWSLGLAFVSGGVLVAGLGWLALGGPAPAVEADDDEVEP